MFGSFQQKDSYPPPYQDLKTKLIQWLLDQGIAIVIMVTIVYVLYTERQAEREAARLCNQEIVQRMNETIQAQQQQNEGLYKLLEKIEHNTKNKK